MSSRLQKVVSASLVLAGCQYGAPSESDTRRDPIPDDIADALAALPEAQVLMATDDGVPTYVIGELAKVGAMQIDDAATADRTLRPQLAPVLKLMRLAPTDLALRKMNVDENGHRHFRYTQKRDGLDVIGADLVVHVDIKGAV